MAKHNATAMSVFITRSRSCRNRWLERPVVDGQKDEVCLNRFLPEQFSGPIWYDLDESLLRTCESCFSSCFIPFVEFCTDPLSNSSLSHWITIVLCVLAGLLIAYLRLLTSEDFCITAGITFSGQRMLSVIFSWEITSHCLPCCLRKRAALVYKIVMARRGKKNSSTKLMMSAILWSKWVTSM